MQYCGIFKIAAVLSIAHHQEVISKYCQTVINAHRMDFVMLMS